MKTLGAALWSLGLCGAIILFAGGAARAEENWIQATAAAPWSARNSHTSLVFNAKMWVLGGYAVSGSRNDGATKTMLGSRRMG